MPPGVFPDGSTNSVLKSVRSSSISSPNPAILASRLRAAGLRLMGLRNELAGCVSDSGDFAPNIGAPPLQNQGNWAFQTHDPLGGEDSGRTVISKPEAQARRNRHWRPSQDNLPVIPARPRQLR